MRMRTLVMLVLVCGAERGAAQDAAKGWRALAEADVSFAERLLRNNHPGAAPELGDAAFRRTLDSTIAVAHKQAQAVAGWDGYVAVMRGLAYGIGDKHIWFRALHQPITPHWGGAIAALRGGTWLLVDGDSARPAPVGGELVSCDGVPIADYARQRLASTHGVWSVEAQRITAAPFLFVDEGSPFVPLPKSCVVKKDGQTTTWSPEWRSVSRAVLSAKIAAAAPVGRAGFGIRPFAKGFWVGMESLNDRAAKVADSAKARAEELRKAPMIVVDVRGNGGGNSQYGGQLAAAIWGDGAVRAAYAALGEGDPACQTLMRASADNIVFWEKFVADIRARDGKEAADRWQGTVDEMKAAQKAGKALSGPVCEPSKRPASVSPDYVKALPANVTAGFDYHGTVVLLTDHACFSSCLLMTQLFRTLGAVHVGEATDGGTNYMEVREEMLPSLLGYFSTLQKVALNAPPLIGPFRPSKVYSGLITDMKALEAWIAAMAP